MPKLTVLRAHRFYRGRWPAQLRSLSEHILIVRALGVLGQPSLHSFLTLDISPLIHHRKHLPPVSTELGRTDSWNVSQGAERRRPNASNVT